MVTILVNGRHDMIIVQLHDINQTDWYRSLRANRLLGHLDAIHHRLDYTPPDAWPRDDITIVALRKSA
jgi:hypothetical protein